ncbi:hypothetical protein [Flagellimonas meridianipacifica]|uniref:Uncharacterized protein n=1 Tax=Flagellimonas meridianipacifica TaxID=1080225 RepID=A0A2T0MBB7_9FLAO|nr:hypothetical protein [Allomuricauda pacifica]PRX54793.1 hypothetical protein CLV81_3197 [Allomuricauda pacifica]
MGQSQVNIVIPTSDEEADYVWRNLQDIPFFDKNGYHLNLPKGKLIDELVEKSRNGNLHEEDYQRLKSLMGNSIYNREDYLLGYDKSVAVQSLVQEMLKQIDPSIYNWHFKKFEEYKVTLTLYGPGGSYDPDTGSIILFTTTQGKFKNYDNPANTIIHEIVHMGIEESLIQANDTPHTLKERIVDQFVSLYFGDILKDYRIQDMGDYRIDPYLKDKSDINQLDDWIKSILE